MDIAPPVYTPPILPPGKWVRAPVRHASTLKRDRRRRVNTTDTSLGLYRHEFEKDSCGFGLIANMDGKASHWLVQTAVNSLACLTHRGAVAADGKSGDGCGLLMKLPVSFMRAVAAEAGLQLAERFAVGMVFLNQDQAKATAAKQRMAGELAEQGFAVAGWRAVPVDPSACGAEALKTLPHIEQVFVNVPAAMDDVACERHLYIARRRSEKAIIPNDSTFYVPSLSRRVLSYKGLVMPANLPVFYRELQDERLASDLCVFHQRFSTNTWPEWRLAQPFRYLAHNGEINTIQGNRYWSVARGNKFEMPAIPNMDDIRPLVSMTGSDSSSMDNMLEALLAGGMDIFRAMRLLIPPAWNNVETMDPDLRAFYEYHSMHMEPWDGPAGIVLTDGRYAACVMDRNGLRPARYVVTKARHITLASEIGVYGYKPEDVVATGRLRPGEMLFAALIGYGATAVYPYLAYQCLYDMARSGEIKGREPEALAPAFRKGINKGLYKVMSKMGISTVASYRGAQLFEALGLNSEVVDLCFTGTSSRIQGANFEDLQDDQEQLAREAWLTRKSIQQGGLLKFIHGGEYHAYNPDVVTALRHAVQTGDYADYRKYADFVNQRPVATFRDLLKFREGLAPISVDEVEPIEAILPRFDSAGMSLGALSPEAHEARATAMNRLGGRSNSGEGGEDPARYGTERMSKIKQVASGRFGVTPAYLVNAEVLQIKIAQGAKPGEGGQLPGDKVNKLIARLRYARPGVALISPPPHHDIYSIEDLAQLIFDLKQVNPEALVSVKLVAEPGVGTIAAGVAKAYADLITISGYDGGTGASPLTSSKYAGGAWELGLTETHQTLRRNDLRSKVRLQTDGGLKTGLDVVKAAMLGAESFGFGTGPMIALGCKYLRICHLNNCATGVATQDDNLRKAHFIGLPEMVMNYFRFLAQETREWMALLGVRTMAELIGRTDLLDVKEGETATQRRLDLTPLLSDGGVRFVAIISGYSGVLEGCGDHGCDYMTGCVVVVLGNTGLNFGAGMTGGFSFVLDLDKGFVDRYNHELVDIHRVTTAPMEIHRNYLRGVIEEFVSETGSAWGREILDDFAAYLPRFWLVKPKALEINSLLDALLNAA